MSQIFSQSFGVTWRKALLSAPRLVPDSVLYLTSPEGPHPVIINIPSRGRHLIPLYVFLPRFIPSLGIVKHPVLLDFHGGGFVFGSCQEQAPFCSKMTRELNTITISVDYRLGPAAKFPAAIEDAEDVVKAIMSPENSGYKELRSAINHHLHKSARPAIQLDETRISISGFSSGGNLALNLALSIKASTSVMLKDDWPSAFPNSFPRAIPLLLFYPSLDCTILPSERPRPPRMEEKKGVLRTLDLESTVMRTYLPLDQVQHPRASPGLADVQNGGLHEKAKMFLVLPELDTLASQSDVWIEKVADEGRSADLSVVKVIDVVHGWTQFPDSWLSEEHRRLKTSVFDEARDFVARAWSSES